MRSAGSIRLAVCLVFLFAISSRGLGGGLTPEETDSFETNVRPLLAAHCITCHGAAKQESDLRLTSREDILAGGFFGPAIVPGKPEESLLLEALRYESYEMPPDGQLGEEKIEGIRKWIAAGAPWPEGVVLQPAPKITAEDRDWWCYQPVVDPQVPRTDDQGWCRNEIDEFVAARLSAEGISPAKQADARQLARRAHYSLTGLPPDEATVAMAADGFQEGEYEALVDRLLDDPAYGENQARYWLDLVRYADSDGYRADHERPEVHRYRDYVIRSFNADKPYDRFVTEQLAGDEVDPGNPDAIVATMYLRHWIYEHNQRDVEGQWEMILNDITETTADVFMAQGVKCARCHDHKFDPIPQRDYYRLQAFFAAFQPREDLPVADLAERAAHEKQWRVWEEATEAIRQRLHEIERPALLAHATGEGTHRFVKEIFAMIAKRPRELTPYERQIAALASRQFQVHPDKLPEWLDDKQQAERQRLRTQLAEFDSLKPKPLPTMKFVAGDVGPVAPPTHIPGAEEQPPIEPGFLTILEEKPAQIVPPPTVLQSTGRRTALARWLTDPKNPFTARVIVNRVWQQHFGQGLVETASDFGKLGQPPSHPKLLDWLASRFIEDGWSIKKLHRRIATSAAFRQSSRRTDNAEIAKIDPGNRLLWRMNPRRLSGEEIVDTILSASGELDSEKRAVYKPVRRNSPDPLLAVFDFPDRITSNAKRHRTTTSTQALVLGNNPWSHECASVIAQRLGDIADEGFAPAAYAALYGREPDREELGLAVRFMEEYRRETPPALAPPDPTQLVEMPGTGGKAANFDAEGRLQLGLESSEHLPADDFTVEAVVLLRSLHEDASVRTIVAHWNGDHHQAGWSLGVTSKTSAYQPRNLILQLVGKTKEGDKLHYEVVPSGLRPKLNTPYYLAVSVDLDDTSERGIAFYLKDLSIKNAEMQIAQAKHSVTSGIRPPHDLGIGGRLGAHRWDGLIDSLRIESGTTAIRQVADVETSRGEPGQAIDWRFENPEKIGLDSSPARRHASAQVDRPDVKTPSDRARVALIHALLNSNELIYID